MRIFYPGNQGKHHHGADELYAARAAEDKRRADESDAGDADDDAGHEEQGRSRGKPRS